MNVSLNWDKNNGLIPVVVQDSVTLQVLMLGYMNQEALALTIASEKVTFFSRTKNRIWLKGETSGNYLRVVSITADCDQDTLLITAEPAGNTCHLGNKSCFGESALSPFFVITQLENIIEQRRNQNPENSYVSQLFNAGTQRIAQKVGEEGVETALAGACGEDQDLISEAADLFFHILILLTQRRLGFSNILNELSGRMRE